MGKVLFLSFIVIGLTACGKFQQVHAPEEAVLSSQLDDMANTPAEETNTQTDTATNSAADSMASQPPQPSSTPNTPSNSNTPPPTAKVTYTKLSSELLLKKCIGCHSPNRVPLLGGATFTNYQESARTVIPGRPLESDMYKAASRIGPKATGFITEAEMQMIYDWILDGALNN